MRKREPAAGKPAVTLPSRMTEQDRAIVARRAAGETIQAIALSLSIPQSQVLRAEHRAYREQRAQEFFAKHPDSIQGLEWLGVLNEGAGPLRCHKYHYEGGDLERLSDVAALGRHYVSCLKGIGPKSLASIDNAMSLFGLEWSPVDRTPKSKPRQPQEQEREQVPADDHFWSSIVRSVGKMERDIGSALLKDHPNRDSVEGVSCRLAYLSGYIESWSEYRRKGAMRDITPEPDDQDDGEYETAGNLICLPGVKLADVRPNDGARS